MIKRLLYILCVVTLYIACEDAYKPAIDKSDGTLVVDALVTNDPSKCYVRLSLSGDFYSKEQYGEVTGAKVDLIESTGKVISAYENGTGNFLFKSYPEAGKGYKLRINWHNLIFESAQSTMPQIPSITSFYGEDHEKTIYKPDSYGIPKPYTLAGKQFYLDAPVTPTLAYYRFSIRSLIEWIYFPPVKEGPPPPPIYGWESFYERASYNIAGPKNQLATSGKVEKHPLLMIAYNPQEYLHTDTLGSAGWILMIDQYGTSADSYDYHQKLNSQFAADGTLFDPIQTQIYGNITCKSDPTKVVFGYFDLNSYRQYRYYTNFSSPLSAFALRELYKYPLIPDEGQVQGFKPAWWE
ncbi:MAG: DUF4249 domain-containing protein [Marinilabiliales bacterium]|nr:DUF4249 domain-containing protein [Marinilabiliales bacterium]